MKRLLQVFTIGAALMFPSFNAIASDDLLSGFSFDQSPADLKQNKANAIIEKGAAIVIDVRTPEEYAQGHVVGAYNIPLDGLLDDEKLPLLKEKDTPVLLYCRSGRRSGLAMYHMSNAGYKKVFNMGGVITWEYGLTSEPTQKSFEQAIKDIKPLD
ncbi:MAG: rhodanese-like domain-containing protein [Anaerobiospirillum succiniciproducens]|uniref:rhodanese-like domain-containing protein n=1 Tax=Anaerobiospirillum succiniciproducens TaxID=13335 RepID=UPI0026DDBCA6|nr:rhodanese-like domain-containing protein [Anaerobiospirillum succiniciproducens]MDO4676729.1 rhodanese-like domain-containing protein [Anaerobiospirillum succiniciproducens]